MQVLFLKLERIVQKLIRPKNSQKTCPKSHQKTLISIRLGTQKLTRQHLVKVGIRQVLYLNTTQ